MEFIFLIILLLLSNIGILFILDSLGEEDGLFFKIILPTFFNGLMIYTFLIK